MARGSSNAAVFLHYVVRQPRVAKRHVLPSGLDWIDSAAIVPLGRGSALLWRHIVEEGLSRLPVPIEAAKLPSWKRSRERITSEIERVAHERGYDTAIAMSRSGQPIFLVVFANSITCIACHSGVSCTPST